MAQAKKRGTRKLVLGDRNGLGQVHIDLEAFFEFSFWLAEELEDLISRQEMQYHLARREPGNAVLR
jgi:hypothetical protein